MPSKPENQFNDPVIKQAVCRCWKSECATAALRARVAELLAESDASPRRINRFGWMIWPIAMAATILLAVGMFNRFHSAPLATASRMTPAFQQLLVDRHDACCKYESHQFLPGVDIDNDSAIVKAMHAKLHQPVVMFRPAEGNWSFKGAACCPVGNFDSGHLVFQKGNQAISVFSLPIKTIKDARDGDEFSADFKQHNILGFVRGGAVVCVVSSGPVSRPGLDDLRKMESQMQPRIAMGNLRRNDIMLTELLQPVR